MVQAAGQLPRFHPALGGSIAKGRLQVPVTISDGGGKFQFSNKPQPYPKPKPPYEQFPTVLKLSDGRTVRVSVPVPDGLVIIIDITPEIFGPTAPKGLTVAEWVHHVGHYLKSEPFNAHYIDSYYKPVENQPNWYSFVMLGMGPRGSSVRFEFLKANQKHPARLKIDLNPRKLTPAGFKTLVKIFSDLKGPFAVKALVQSARVSKLDVAVDIVGVQTSEIVAFHPKQGKRSYYIGKDGQLETINIHRTVSPSKPSGNAMVRIYDRVRERQDRGKDPPFGPAAVTRVEVTKAPKKPHNSLVKLLAASDPFADLRVGYVADQVTPSATWATYHALIRTVPRKTVERIMGTAKATAASFATALKVPNAPIVAKGVNWSGWEQGVKVTGLHILLDAGK